MRQHLRLEVDIVAVHRVAIIVVVLGAVITHSKTHAVAAAVYEVGEGGRGRQQAVSGPGPGVKRGVEEPLACRVPGQMDSEKPRLLDMGWQRNLNIKLYGLLLTGSTDFRQDRKIHSLLNIRNLPRKENIKGFFSFKNTSVALNPDPDSKGFLDPDRQK